MPPAVLSSTGFRAPWPRPQALDRMLARHGLALDAVIDCASTKRRWCGGSKAGSRKCRRAARRCGRTTIRTFCVGGSAPTGIRPRPAGRYYRHQGKLRSRSTAWPRSARSPVQIEGPADESCASRFGRAEEDRRIARTRPALRQAISKRRQKGRPKTARQLAGSRMKTKGRAKATANKDRAARRQSRTFKADGQSAKTRRTRPPKPRSKARSGARAAAGQRRPNRRVKPPLARTCTRNRSTG